VKRVSASSVVATGSLTDGVIRLDEKVATAEALKTVRNGGVVLTVTPSTENTLRLVRLQKYYRAVVIKRLAEVAWTSPENMHGVLCARFLGRPVTIVSTVTGEEITAVVYPSTMDLSGDDFWTYVQQCRAFAADHYKLTIPDPDRAWRLHITEAA